MSEQEGSTTELLIEQLSDLLVEEEAYPDNVSLLRQQIIVLRKLNMTGEMLDAYGRLSSLIMIDEIAWKSYFKQLVDSLPKPLSLESFLDILERFDQAEGDYLSSVILRQHIEFVLSCWGAANTTPIADANEDIVPVDSDVAEFLSEDTVRSIVSSLNTKGQGLLSESDLFWKPWLGWEMSLLQQAGDKTSAIRQIHSLFLSRLAIPHLAMSTTSDTYSTFCSEYCPESYEQRMIEATSVSQAAKTKLSQEKRYGQTREDLEQQLIYATDFTTQAQILITYTKWEADHRVRQHGQGKAPTVDPVLTKAIFERAIRLYASTACVSQEASEEIEIQIRVEANRSHANDKKKRAAGMDELQMLQSQKRILQEAIRAYKDAEASIWTRFAGWVDGFLSSEEKGDILMRAVRSCPQNGDLWCQLMLHMESQGNNQADLAATFERALALGQLLVPSDRTSDLAQAFTCRAAQEGRIADHEAQAVFAVLLRGLEAVQQVNKNGDSSLKIEKYLLDWAENKAPDFLEQATLTVDKPLRARNSAYQMVLLRTALEIRRGEFVNARALYLKAIQRSDLDWPESVYEAFLQFEHLHGTLKTIADATQHIAREQEKVTRRREKLALEQAEASQVYEQPVEQPLPAPSEAMEVDQTVKGTQAAKEAESHLKRDREHTTILVTGLPPGVEQDAISSFFSECGPIREVTILDENRAALVEFRAADSVPAALTRDHKRIGGVEVSVSMLWRSTLFITNFSREADDETIRALFSQYGRILQTRWPSRKYADSRRFCYVTMESPAAAQEALVLHGYKMGEAFGLTVLISDPSAKAKRTDASNSTLFVGGLNAKTTEVDVRGIFCAHGTVQSIKLGWDPIKRICKGFAFVEMESDANAQAALAVHGSQFEGKYLKVELSDPNFANKKAHERNPERAAERRARSVKLSNLPADTQEGLLQQALEKLVPVKRLEIFIKDHEAVAELETPADVGKLLLRTEPFIFGGNEIGLAEQTRRPLPGKALATAAAAPSSSPAFVPRAARRAKLIPKPRPVAANAPTTITKHDQGDFRAMVAEKNQERAATGEKRKTESEESVSKRLKP